jgi:ring-1,2-phenylacetyl-CoA epoxidase subunit PaaB
MPRASKVEQPAPPTGRDGGKPASDGSGKPSDGSGQPHAGGAAGKKGESQWPLWEIFAQEGEGAPHEHVGSLHAPDAELALQNARDVYARRGPIVSIWVVPSIAITASPSDEAGPFFEPGADKVYRHPQFYKIPRGIKGF